MRRIFTVVVLLTFALVVLLQAEEKQDKIIKLSDRYSIANKTMKVIPKPIEKAAEAMQTSSSGSSGSGFVRPPMRLNKTNGETVYSLIDSSLNGYGWIDSGIRGIDRFKGTDALGNSVDRLFAVYRQHIAGDTYTGYIGAHEIEVSSGLDNGSFYRATHVEVDMSNDGSVGGRYTGAVALDYPFAAFNWYKQAHPTTQAALSHPYLVTDYNGGYVNDVAEYDWTAPDWLMDDGWLHPDLAGVTNPLFPADAKENRLWRGAVDVVKDNSGVYHYAGIFSHWVSDAEQQQFGLQNDQVALAAHTNDPLNSMTYSWDEGTDPTIWEYADVTILTRAIDMNASGFGVIATIGQLNYPVDSSLYYDTLYVTYTTTNDYGYTWSAWDTLSFFNELGFPSQVQASDSLWYVNDNGDTVLYVGPAEVYCNDQVDVIVSDNNDIYIGFSAFWGGVDGAHGIMYSPYYSGQWVAIYDVDSSYWTGRHIAYNNGVYAGDESLPTHTLFWDSEIDLAFDDAGNLYAAWLDRPRTNVEYGALPRYSVDDDPNTDERDYKTDIYVARSTNGGFDWSGWVNITGTPQVDEYELNMVKTVDSRTDGTVWVGYNVCVDTTGADPQAEAYVDRKNQIWVREARGLFPPAAIDDDNPLVARKYSLEQNYPNPFNPVTHIEFVPVKAGKAQLKVYNAAGQLVNTLYNGNVNRGAKYEFEFDGTGLASGVYFYQLTLDDQSEVKKMVLLK
ncbi:MAG TPA: T9SS type A sorting domain-containing protein [Caldithrix abyssi]|uniref:T9SS type A sorting domain-containing protein n=1 Tax=Caldithrix abyssi TaxID=187145 RepID=A0A7V4U013_CALAY|nr:T9SS type A sorting domain-containing protein [Caldithrix abyssi]